jgi:hypothetical protein
VANCALEVAMRISLVLLLLAATSAAAQSVNDAALSGIKVTSGRSSAWAQFNMNAVRLWLPRVPNSAYATEEFAAPKLIDAKGTPVPHELEQGIYDHDKWENEIRFQTKGNPARMIGTIHVRYPVKTRAAKKSDAEDKVTKPASFVNLPPVVVEQWKDVDIMYDLPVVAKLPDSQSGLTQPVPDKIVDTPGGKVVVTLKK